MKNQTTEQIVINILAKLGFIYAEDKGKSFEQICEEWSYDIDAMKDTYFNWVEKNNIKGIKRIALKNVADKKLMKLVNQSNACWIWEDAKSYPAATVLDGDSYEDFSIVTNKYMICRFCSAYGNICLWAFEIIH